MSGDAMSTSELKTLRRNTDLTLRGLTEEVNAMLDKIEELSQKLHEVEDERDEALARVEELEAEARDR